MPIDTSHCISLGGVNCVDMSTKESFGRIGSQAERIIRCDWTNRVTLAVFLAGGASVVGGIPITVPPQSYPDAGYLYCHQVDIEGVPGKAGLTTNTAGTLIAYDYAELKCTYKPFEFQVGVEQGEENLDFGADSQVINTTTPCFQWSDNSKNLDVLGQPNVRFSVVHFTKVINNIPTLPVSAIIALTDHVNSGTFFGAPAGYLLFRGARSVRRFAVGGNSNWSISYAFSYRSQDWRKHYRPGGDQGAAGWTTVTYTNGDPLYASGDFSNLGLSGI